MRGVLTLAGEGTRMLPWTRGLRKEFLPVWDQGANGTPVLKPVAHVVLETLVGAGIDDVTLVVAPKDLAFVQNYFTIDQPFLKRHQHHAERLRETTQFYTTLRALRLRFAVQPRPRGFGDAVLQTEPFVGHEPFVLHAADAVLLERHRGELPRLMHRIRDKDGLDGVLLVRRVTDPRRYGVVEGMPDGSVGAYRRLNVRRMEEKPPHPRSHWAATAVYAFAPELFGALKRIRDGRRPRELELTEAIQELIREGRRIDALVVDPRRAEWRSVGSPEGFLKALKATRRWLARSTR
ncbi:MAG TPA: sugar phosphate nucleotidyltransferase [Thermoplasmata archaeon]|nr:sugar phosphate nucleotidyltransferase [Thermoplasmata archaeon]